MKDFSAVGFWFFFVRFCIRYLREWQAFWREFKETQINLENLRKEEAEKVKKEEMEKMERLEEEFAKLKEESESRKKK